MPTSHPNQINEIVQISELIQPRSILDVGVGNGKYGFLLREYLGVNRNLSKENLIIDGIEGYEKYITDAQREIYNSIHISDLCGKIELPSKNYDLCLLIDIIEHFERDKGIEIVNYFSSISKYLLIATPWDIGDPAIRHDNPLEDHKYQWVKNDFQQFGNHNFIYNRNSLVILLGKDKDQLIFISRKMRHMFYKNIYDFIRRSIGIKRG